MQKGDLASFQPLPELMVQISLAFWFVHSFYMQTHSGLALALLSFVFFYWQAFKAREENGRRESGLFILLHRKILPAASFQLLFNPFSLHLRLFKHKDWISANWFWKQRSTWVERSKVRKLSGIRIRKRHAPHFTSHHHLKVKFPSIVINAPSYPAWRNVLHFQHVTLSGKIDHQTAPQSPHCAFALRRIPTNVEDLRAQVALGVFPFMYFTAAGGSIH